MARIGKCKQKDCDGWVTLNTYANWKQSCDGVGVCRICGTEHRLEYKSPKSMHLSIMADWKLKED